MSDTVLVPAAIAAEIAKAPAAISFAGYAMLGFGGIIIVVLILIFVKAQFSRSKIDMADLLIDPSLGKITQGRFWGLIGGGAGTWVFIYLPVSGHFDAAYASVYLVAAFGLKVAGDVTGKPDGAPTASSTTTKTEKETITKVEAAAVPVVSAPVADTEMLAAGRGVEPLPAVIGPNDVGKRPAMVSKRKKRSPSKAKPPRNR